MADDYRNRSRRASNESQEPIYHQSDYNQDNYGNMNYDRESDWRNMNRNREANYGFTSYGNTGNRINDPGGYENIGYGRRWEENYDQNTSRPYGNYSDSLGANYAGSNYNRREDWGRANVDSGMGSYSSDYGRGYNDYDRNDYENRYNDRYNMGYGNRGYDKWRRASQQRSMYGGDTSNYGNMNQAGYDRGWWDRTRDEVSSWFGDEDAEHRRRRDRRMDTGGYRGKGPKDYHRSEDRIREDVCDRLTDDDMLDATNIHVEIKADEVILSGTVNNREQKRRAEDLVESISGVRDVENRIRINRDDEPFSERATEKQATSERNRNK